MAKNCNIMIAGAAGRMGQAIAKAVLSDTSSNYTLIGGFDHSASPHIGKDIGHLVGLNKSGMTIQTNPSDIGNSFDKETTILIDFTLPKACLEHAQYCAQNNIAHVIGATGFSQHEEAQLATIAVNTPTVKSGNMSMGVTLLTALIEQAAAKLNDDFDIEINEAHHRFKVDAPSGTALLLGHAAAKGRAVNFEDKSVRGRDGITGERQRGDIGFSVIRGGGIVGDHEAMFIGDNEVITLSHHAIDRKLFADGALRAAYWLINGSKETNSRQQAGIYTMRDVLDI